MKYFLMFLLLVSLRSFGDSPINSDAGSLSNISLVSKTASMNQGVFSEVLELDLGIGVKDKTLTKIEKLAKIRNVKYKLLSDDNEYPISTVKVQLDGDKDSVKMISSAYK